ncbi:MAG: glycerophosphodiester phosphodiesterase family protein [Promethearchaeota archaeon]
MDINSFLRRKGKKWLLLDSLLIINMGVLTLIMLIFHVYWGDINLIVSDYISFDINLVFMIIIILLLPLIYGTAILHVHLRNIKKNNEIKPCILNKVIPIVLMLIYSILFALLLYYLEQYSRLIPQVIELYSMFITLPLSLLLILGLYPLLKSIKGWKNHLSNRILNAEIKSKVILGILITGYFLAFAYPLLFIPSNVIYGYLPPKPNIIAHRGASHLAPENTIVAGELAVEHGAVGWEVDIQISVDGELFLLHDETLTRTTNVEDIFPNRKNNLAETFTLSELRQLDAGGWFADKDPYGALAFGHISKEEGDNYRGMQIPTFEEVLNFTRDNDFFIDFDTKLPSSSHLYSDLYFESILNKTLESGINLTRVMIFTSNAEWINLINQKNATDILLGMDMRSNPSLEEFEMSAYNYSIIKTGDEYSNELYKSFYSNSIPLMVYTIDSIERFNQLWCLGASFVMTNEVHTFNDLKAPIWYLNIEIYILIWSIIYITTLSSLLTIKFKFVKKDNKH